MELPLQYSKQAHQQTHQLARPKLWLSWMRLVVVVVMFASRSKSHQKVVIKSKNRQKDQKASKVWKICKSHWFERTFTKTPILCQLNAKNSNFHKSSDSFQALFARLKSSLNITFRAITNKEKLMELLVLFWLLTRQSWWNCWCFITFLIKSLTSAIVPCTKAFVYKTHIIFWNNSGRITYIYQLTSHDLHGNELQSSSHLEL